MRTVLFLTSGFLNFFRKVRFSFSLLFLSLFLLSVLFSVFQMDDGWLVSLVAGLSVIKISLVFFPFILLCLCYVYILKQNNPLFILFILIAMVLTVVICFFCFGVELLSVLFLIIYVGAIAILFLFVIMLFDIRKVPSYSWPFYLWKGFLLLQKFVVSLFLYIRILFFFVYDCFIRILLQSSILVSSLFFLLMLIYVVFLFYSNLFHHSVSICLQGGFYGDQLVIRAPGNVLSHIMSQMAFFRSDFFIFHNFFLITPSSFMLGHVNLLLSVFLIIFLPYVLFFAFETFVYGFRQFLINAALQLMFKLADLMVSYYWIVFGISCVILFYFDFIDIVLFFVDQKLGSNTLGLQSLAEPGLSFATSISEINIIFTSLFQDNVFFLFIIMFLLLSSLISAVFICTVFF